MTETTTSDGGLTETTVTSGERPCFRDYTVDELRAHNGTEPDKTILLAVDGKVFDVTKGKDFYGPGGPYCAFAGRDATRGMCKFEVVPSEDPVNKQTLTKIEAESLKNWLAFYEEKYTVVGKLVRPQMLLETKRKARSGSPTCNLI